MQIKSPQFTCGFFYTYFAKPLDKSVGMNYNNNIEKDIL